LSSVPAASARRTEILDRAAELFASSGMRTSVKEIADACGILPGSLYHHFESKEAIVVELVERYRAELDALAEATLAALPADDRPVAEQLESLGTAIAACAVRHRAAFLFTLYEPPSSAGDELVAAARRPSTMESAVLAVLRAGEVAGGVRPGLDLPTLADRFFQVLLHSSLPVVGNVLGPDSVSAIRCRALLHGIAVDAPSNRALDRSAPFAAAQRTVDDWARGGRDEDERLPLLRAAARSEFGRRGYETTTVRDVAKAAGLSVGTVYRLVGSKDALLGSIMGAFTEIARTGWRNVLRAEGTVVEKLDALTWVDINAVDRYTDEYNIQLAFIREAPPRTVDVGATFTARLRDLKSLLATGTRGGEVRVEGASSDVRAWALFELLWMPESVIGKVGPRGALELARETTLRGFSPPGRRRT
jgi:AcrR family transcriptional regulator